MFCNDSIGDEPMRSLALIAGLSAALAVAAPAAAVTYDAFASFDGTQGAGGFYYGFTDGATTASLFDTGCSFEDFCLTVPNPVLFTPLVYKALTGSQPANVIVPDDRLVMHPGATAADAAFIAFLAPATAIYTIDALFSVQDLGTTGIGVTVFYKPFDDALVTGAIGVLDRSNLGFTFGDAGLLRAGDVYGFIIDRQGNFFNDSTGVGFTVATVPEPASWTLLIAGFGLVGAALRRRAAAVA
jgi:hypothetical protein